MTDSKTVVEDLAGWLTQIWDEEERLANACLGVNVLAGMRRGIEPPRWVRDGSSIYDERPDGSGPPIVRVRHSWAREIDHIILHDPASVLARIAADRKILAAYQQVLNERPPNDPYQEGMVRGWCDGLDLAIRQLASVYADRPGFRPEWSVERQGVEW